MNVRDDIAIYGALRRSSRDEVMIWILFLCVIGFAVIGSTLLGDTILVVGSLIVLGGIVFAFVFDSLVAVRTKENLSLALSRLANVVAEVQEGIIIYDDGFHITVMNRQAEKFLEVKKENVLGRPCMLGSPESSLYPRLFQILYPSLAQRAVLRSAPGAYPNITDITFGAPPRTFRIYTNRLTDARGTNLGFIKVMHDRTEDEQIISSKNDFLTVAAHQLRTPLTAINWALEALRGEQSLSKENKTFVDAASITANKLSATVNDLLEAARIEGGKTEYSFTKIDVRKIVEAVRDEELILAKEYNVTIEVSAPKEEVIIFGDEEKLKLALANLVENAIRYNKKDGKVSITFENNTTHVILRVEDAGIGIPEDAMPKLFTRFFRAENVIKKETEGTGLGLFIAKSIIEAHGGTIQVQSTLHEGTVFTIIVPRAKS